MKGTAAIWLLEMETSPVEGAAEIDSGSVQAVDSSGQLTVAQVFGRRYFDSFGPGNITRHVITALPGFAHPDHVIVRVTEGRWLLRGIHLTELATTARYSTAALDLWLSSADDWHVSAARFEFKAEKGHCL